MPFSTRNLVLRASLGTSTLSLLFPDLTVNFYTVQLIHNSALFGSHGISAMTPIILDIQLSCQQRYLIFAHQKNVRVHYLISLGWYISRISRLTFFFFSLTFSSENIKTSFSWSYLPCVNQFWTRDLYSPLGMVLVHHSSCFWFLILAVRIFTVAGMYHSHYLIVCTCLYILQIWRRWLSKRHRISKFLLIK